MKVPAGPPVTVSAVATAMGIVQATTVIGSVQAPSPEPSAIPDEPMSRVWKPSDLLKQGVWKPTCGWKEHDCDSDEDENTSSVAKVSSALCPTTATTTTTTTTTATTTTTTTATTTTTTLTTTTHPLPWWR